MELLRQGRQEGVAGVAERQDTVNVMEAGEDSLEFLHSLVAAFTAMLVSEFGDRTFLMAAVLAMRHSRLAVLLGSLSAMVAMTLLSVLVGCATVLVPVAVTHYAAAVLFAVCGIKMLMEGWSMSDTEGTEEYEEVVTDLDKMETERRDRVWKTGGHYSPGFTAVFLQSLTLTLVAEWGDRSQVSTIALAATEDAVGVALGSFLGNAVVTVMAVVAGRLLAERVSVRTVTLVGGLVFNMFALSKLLHPHG